MLKYYLVLLSLISFLVILSKCYLSCITSLRYELSLTFIFGNEAGVVVVVVVIIITTYSGRSQYEANRSTRLSRNFLFFLSLSI